MITIAPLQLYASCILFAPRMCAVRQSLQNELLVPMRRVPSTPQEWSHMEQMLDISHPTGMKFSPFNDSLLAVSDFSSVQIWDLSVGTQIQQLKGEFREIIFSPHDPNVLGTIPQRGFIQIGTCKRKLHGY